MVIIISAIIIFILLSIAEILAFTAPITSNNAEKIIETAPNNLLVILAEHSEDVPAVVDIIG